jgi:hypothetical protein
MSEGPSVPNERQEQLHTAIVNELIALTPEWWNSALLKVSVVDRKGIQSMSHEITSPQGHRELISPSDELFALTRQLFLLFQEFGQRWKQVTYEADLTPKGNWKFKCHFTYQ